MRLLRAKLAFLYVLLSAFLAFSSVLVLALLAVQQRWLPAIFLLLARRPVLVWMRRESARLSR